MTEKEWKERCAARFVKRGGLDKDDANYNAEICFDEFYRDDSDSPEYCADESMSYWSGDEG